MTNRECARWLALGALLPFAQSRLEDMHEATDRDCLCWRVGNAAVDLAIAACNEGVTPGELAAARERYEGLRSEFVRAKGLCDDGCTCPRRASVAAA